MPVCFSTSFQNFGCLWNFPEEREADTGTIFHQVVAILSTEDELNGEEFRKSCRVCIHQYSERKIRKEKDDEVRHFLKGFFNFYFFLSIYLCICLHQVLVRAHRISDLCCGMLTLSCSMWNLVPCAQSLSRV